jgi:hypothetical protein
METGATGLEPATFGVTGRFGTAGCDRLRPGITGRSRGFLDPRTGCDRLRPAAVRHSLCGKCAAGVVPTSTTMPCRFAEHTRPPQPSYRWARLALLSGASAAVRARRSGRTAGSPGVTRPLSSARSRFGRGRVSRACGGYGRRGSSWSGGLIASRSATSAFVRAACDEAEDLVLAFAHGDAQQLAFSCRPLAAVEKAEDGHGQSGRGNLPLRLLPSSSATASGANGRPLRSASATRRPFSGRRAHF